MTDPAAKPKLVSGPKPKSPGERAFVLPTLAAELPWKNARRYDELVSGRAVYTYVDSDPLNHTDPLGLETKCDDKTCTITADNGPKQGRTITASAEVKAVTNVGKDAAATKGGSTEKVAAVEKTGDGKLAVTSVKASSNGSSSTGTTASVKLPGDTVAAIHGHIDSGPDKSNGMVDSPLDNGGLGDASALKVGIPMATVSQGEVGWHEMVNGTLQFSVPTGSMTTSQMSDMQQNLNIEQKQFP